MAIELAKLPEPITVLFSDPGACTGYAQFVDNRITGTLQYWTAAGTRETCDPPLTGQPADFAHMGNTADFCAGGVLPADVGDFGAPIQTINLITDKDSSQTALSAEALYFIFGFGSEAQVTPWVDDFAIFHRRTNSFVHLFIADVVGVPPTGFPGGETTERSTNDETVEAVATAGATDPERTLGYVSGSAADKGAERGLVKTLAYQHYGQSCGYLPDSSPTRLDKLNVRLGQYYLWTPGHFFARKGGAGEIVNPRVKDLVDWFGGKPAPGGIDVTRIVIESGDVPQCAMRATRAGVTGPISSFAPAEPCGCYFEQIATGSTSCTACTTDTECSGDSPKCRSGFCEA
ncbi:MAG: hypothetical protein KIT72_06750 [Polyangiaceae bacterium]|nr:hypothetical protein [Polyangiaceae bacterium]MCW5790102.1 hypothetical protein [Polyangiaceae bacterium]